MLPCSESVAHCLPSQHLALLSLPAISPLVLNQPATAPCLTVTVTAAWSRNTRHQDQGDQGDTVSCLASVNVLHICIPEISTSILIRVHDIASLNGAFRFLQGFTQHGQLSLNNCHNQVKHHFLVQSQVKGY